MFTRSITQMKKITSTKVLNIRNLTDSTYVLRLEKNNFQFKAGQYLVLDIPGKFKAREYSIYNSESTPFLDLLIKEVNGGEVSIELKHLKIGTLVEIAGPYGFFVLRDTPKPEAIQYTFIATGTGISPFHSIILSNPNLDYQIIHGVKTSDEAYDRSDYLTDRYTLCTTRDNGGDFHGRVTQYLRQREIAKDAIYYICGNSEMVNDVTEILEQNGITSKNIRTEIFF
jgi:ferredoxin/flavodoxin---NADP+ reductase